MKHECEYCWAIWKAFLRVRKEDLIKKNINKVIIIARLEYYVITSILHQNHFYIQTQSRLKQQQNRQNLVIIMLQTT